MTTKAEKAAEQAEARAEEAATRRAEDKAAVAEQSVDVKGTPVLHSAEGVRQEGTFSRPGVGGFVEIVNASTGEVVARHEVGGPAPE